MNLPEDVYKRQRKAAADYDFEELTEMLENVVEYAERKVQ